MIQITNESNELSFTNKKEKHNFRQNYKLYFVLSIIIAI